MLNIGGVDDATDLELSVDGSCAGIVVDREVDLLSTVEPFGGRFLVLEGASSWVQIDPVDVESDPSHEGLDSGAF